MNKLFQTFGLLILLFVSTATQSGEWFPDEATGCLVWNNNHQPNERVTWSGGCKGGKGFGLGKVQFIRNGVGASLKCELLDGVCEGFGVTESSNGNRFEGTYIHGKRNGTGIFSWANGDRYEGNFADGERTGKGQIFWVNGSRYEGDFVKGKLEGFGVFFRPDGTREESRFVSDKAIGSVLTTRPDGSTFERQAIDSPFANNPIPCIYVQPVYPANARRNGIEGDLSVSALISDGVIKDITMLSGQTIFLDAVREALTQSKCQALKEPRRVVEVFHFKLEP